jgi:hypothetical protein
MLNRFKRRLYATKQQPRLRDLQLEKGRWRSNRWLAERRDVWEQRRQRVRLLRVRRGDALAGNEPAGG